MTKQGVLDKYGVTESQVEAIWSSTTVKHMVKLIVKPDRNESFNPEGLTPAQKAVLHLRYGYVID